MRFAFGFDGDQEQGHRPRAGSYVGDEGGRAHQNGIHLELKKRDSQPWVLASANEPRPV